MDKSEFSHNPYFNRWFSAIEDNKHINGLFKVTILILIDGFLQYMYVVSKNKFGLCHNPYFNRWFSAIKETVTDKTLKHWSQSLF